MKYHAVLNASSEDYESQSMQIAGFIHGNCKELEEGHTFIISDGIYDEDNKLQLTEMAPTRSVIFVIMNYVQAEGVLDFLEQRIDLNGLYLFGSNYSGNELAVRLAVRGKGSSLINCSSLDVKPNKIMASKMVYSNQLEGTFALKQAPFCISIVKGGGKRKDVTGRRIIQEEHCLPEDANDFILERKCTQIVANEGLEIAKNVLIAGKGVKNKENAEQLSCIAKKINFAYGITRPVAMNAWAPMQQLVGASGAMLKPEICITAGVSGAPALYVGIEKSKFIIGINTDERAPIIKKADVVIVEDYQKVMESLVKLMEEDI